MRKTFSLTHEKIKPARLVESSKSYIRKYIKKERKKALPEGVDFWDFDCKFGPTSEYASVIHVDDINKAIDEVYEKQLESFYVEVIAKPGHRTKKPKPTA